MKREELTSQSSVPMNSNMSSSEQHAGCLSKDQAIKLAEITSSVYQQGGAWVFSEWHMETGTQKLTRGLSEKAAKNKLKNWRKERIETLLRGDGSGKAYTLKKWHKNPSWQGEGIWQWFQKHWYTTQEDALKVLEKKQLQSEDQFEVFEHLTSEIPGHFTVH